jgi:hypothetical protein
MHLYVSVVLISCSDIIRLSLAARGLSRLQVMDRNVEMRLSKRFISLWSLLFLQEQLFSGRVHTSLLIPELCIRYMSRNAILKQLKKRRPPLWSSGQSSCLQSVDVLCFLWGTNWIYICYAEESRPPLWSSGQSSWLQIRRPRFDSRH